VFSEDHLSFRIQGRRTYIDPATAPHGISSYFKDFTPQDFFVDPSYMEQFRGKEFVLYGEFIGRGIQKGTALATMDHKFVAIAVRCGKGPILDPPEVKPPLDRIDRISETLVLKSDLSNYKEFSQEGNASYPGHRRGMPLGQSSWGCRPWRRNCLEAKGYVQ